MTKKILATKSNVKSCWSALTFYTTFSLMIKKIPKAINFHLWSNSFVFLSQSCIKFLLQYKIYCFRCFGRRLEDDIWKTLVITLINVAVYSCFMTFQETNDHLRINIYKFSIFSVWNLYFFSSNYNIL